MGVNTLENESSQANSLPVVNVPASKSSRERIGQGTIGTSTPADCPGSE